MTEEQDKLRAENEQLKARLAAYEAKLVGDGAVAQGQNSTAIGKGGIGASDISDSIVNTGTLNLFFAQYQVPSGRAHLSKEDFERILQEYLNWVVKAYGKARLYGLESMRTTREQPRRKLSDVFVPLSLRRFSPPKREEIEELAGNFKGNPFARQKAYLRAVENHRADGDAVDLKTLLTIKERLAVIGGAGCGKSTLSAYLAASLAQAALMGGESALKLPEGRKQLLPLLIPLRYFREYQRLCSESSQEKLKNPRAGKIAGFIPWYLMQRNPAREFSEDFFDRLLLGGGCLLILDGLDEVVNRAERGQVRAQVEAIANDIYPGNLLIVTARESGYREDSVFGDDFARRDVQPLNDEQIELLAHNWCQQLYPEAVEAQTREIVGAIQDINQRYETQELPRLVSSPLMTTMVVSVKWGENELPRERAKLYEAAIKVILQAQYLENDEAQKELVNWGGEWDEQRQWLSYLALEMQRGGRDGAAIPEERVRSILSDYPSMTSARLNTFIQAVRLRGGLFEERAELFQFTHLTFQEFLAARLLVQQRQDGLEALRPVVAETWWREVCLLFYGIAKEDYDIFATEYLDWLSNLETEESRLAGLELAAAAILEIEKPDPFLRRVRANLLLQAFEHASLQTSPANRTRAGNTLAALGDPRFDPERWFLPKSDTLGFIRIPAGKFWMGSDPKKDENARKDEQPQHELDLAYDYWLAKYPITVAQYRAFVEESGYRTNNKDSSNGTANHPVVNVTWFDALEYTRWLDVKLKHLAQELVSQGNESAFWQRLAVGMLQVTLPSESEWEKAARGLNGQIYPWGNDFDLNKANTDPSAIGTTSPVGASPFGASPYGALDMCGSVREWTRSIWDCKFNDYPYKATDGREDLRNQYLPRTWRGIPRTWPRRVFDDSEEFARCAYRGRNLSNLAEGNFGFRVVLSPVNFS